MPSEYILAVDQGTFSTRAVIYDATGRQIALSRANVRLNIISRAEIEQSPDEILGSVNSVIADVLHTTGIHFKDIKCMGLATQRSSVVAWDRDNGQALCPVLSWQDLRSEAQLAHLINRSDDIHRRTGLRLSAHYGAGKIQWLLANNENVRTCLDEGRLVIGPLAGYLLRNILDSGKDLVDDANASRTLLWNIDTGDWDPVLLDMFGVEPSILPVCKPVQTDYGMTRQGRFPVTAVSGDQTAALYAYGMPPQDILIVNIGTGAFVLLPTGNSKVPHEKLLTGISMSSQSDKKQYYIEGTVNGAAAALAWAEQRYNFDNLEVELPGWLDEITHPPIFINTVGGLGAPWWKSGPAPAFPGTTPNGPQAAVAVVESIVFLIQVIIVRMQQIDPAIEAVRVSGGLADLNGLCQRLANLSGLEITRPDAIEASSRGIAWLAAGQPVGWDALGGADVFTPASDTALKQRYRTFIKLLEAL
jgi:glycerol kinase